MATGLEHIGRDHGGAALVDLLHAHGVSVIFGLPGGQTAALYDAIDRDDRIRHVSVLDERSGAYAADAYARLTGRVGVCDATVGPGAGQATVRTGRGAQLVHSRARVGE